RTRQQGPSHWQVLDARRQLETLKLMAGKPQEVQGELAQIGKLIAEANSLAAQGHFAKAEPLFRRCLSICQAALGEDHVVTAGYLHHLAMNLDYQGEHADAELQIRKAMDTLGRHLGADHLDTAECYNNLAHILGEQGKYAEAEGLLRKTL